MSSGEKLPFINLLNDILKYILNNELNSLKTEHSSLS